MRIALFFVAFTLGAGVALGLDVADATARNERRSETVSVVVPETPANHELQVEPIRWDGELAVTSSARGTSTSPWTPGLGDVAVATLVVSTIAAGFLLRRRTLAPVRV